MVSIPACHAGDRGSIPRLGAIFFIFLYTIYLFLEIVKNLLRDGELNPGLPRDRRGYSPLYYLGLLFYIEKDVALIQYGF